MSRNDDIIMCSAGPECMEERPISAIIIDGYNLIGVDHEDLAAEREGVIRMLSDYRKTRGHDITVVFDGWKSGSRREEKMSAGGIRIIYSRLGEKADSVIKRIICTEKKEWIVISSDREIVSRAWACGCVPVSSEKFMPFIEGPKRSVTGEYELLEEDSESFSKKGNAHTPSRKEKALQRALKKL